MEVYDVISIKEGRIDVSRYFRGKDEIVFSYDTKEGIFEARLVISEQTSQPADFELIGKHCYVSSDLEIKLPKWMFELMEPSCKFMVSPTYSRVLKRFTELKLAPFLKASPLDDKLEKYLLEILDAADEDSPEEEDSAEDLADKMLRSAFGEDFDTSVGKPKEVR